MKIPREWATPLTIGSFTLMAVTGALMFFHADVGLNKVAHEWLGWAMVIAVVLHSMVNFGALKRHFVQPTGRALIGIFVAVLVASFFVGGGDKQGGPPFAAPVRALAQTPLSTLAQVARITPEQLRERLNQEGVTPTSETQSLQDLIGPDLHRQISVLGVIIRQP